MKCKNATIPDGFVCEPELHRLCDVSDVSHLDVGAGASESVCHGFSELMLGNRSWGEAICEKVSYVERQL